MSLAIQQNKIYTYKDYLCFPDDFKYEIIEGTPYLMSPSPTVQHQRILRKMFIAINDSLKNVNCEVFSAPLDVILTLNASNVESATNVIQPDIFIICDKSKIKEKFILGSPEFIIEIVSNSSQSTDYVKKLNLYEKFKVTEYWIVNPLNKTIIQYYYSDNCYLSPDIYKSNEVITSKIFKNIKFNLEELFHDDQLT